MKHKLLHLFAAMSGAVLLCTAASAPAAALDYLGTGHFSGDLPESELIDLKGTHLGLYAKDAPFIYRLMTDWYLLIKPHSSRLCFTIRPDLDKPTAAAQALSIIRKYFPDTVEGLADDASVCFYKQNYINRDFSVCYELLVSDEARCTAETAEGIKRDLAKAGLISEFFTWGKPAHYESIEYLSFNLDAYEEFDYATQTETLRDLTPVQAFLDQQHPGWRIETYDSTTCWFTEENVLIDRIPYVRTMLVHDGTYTDTELLTVQIDLYDAFPDASDIGGAYPQFGWDAGELVIGENALAADMDVNLDCSVDVADAVLLARYINSDSEATVCEQGIRNASADGSTQVTTDDITRILMKIAKKI